MRKPKSPQFQLMQKRKSSRLYELRGKYTAYMTATAERSTVLTYERVLRDFFDRKFQNKMRPEEIYGSDVEDYKIMLLREGVKPQSVNTYLRVLKAFFDFCIRMLPPGSMHNPAKGVKKIKEPKPDQRWLALSDMEKLWKACESDQEKLMFLLSITTGLRGAELAQLEFKDFNLDESLLLLPAEKTKSQKQRILPIRKDVMDVLLKVKEELKDGFVFEGFATKAQKMRYRWRCLCWKAEVPPTGLHATRRTYATHLLRAGLDLPTLQNQMGHESLNSTTRYLKAYEADVVRQFIDKIPAGDVQPKQKEADQLTSTIKPSQPSVVEPFFVEPLPLTEDWRQVN